jgi:hypothetical protein
VRPRTSVPRSAVLGLLAALALPATASAAGPKKEFDESEGFEDPRKRDLPRTHRFRLALDMQYIRLTKAADEDGNSQRFHYAPLMLDVAYQAQFAKYLMARIAFAFGGNVANSRNAMPLVILPKAYFGFQGKMFGLAANYGFMYPFPQIPNNTDGRSQSLGQPVISNNHVIGGEASFTSRVDRVALTLAIGAAAVRSQLTHYDLSGTRWNPMFTLSFGTYFDGSIIRARRGAKGKRFDKGRMRTAPR